MTEKIQISEVLGNGQMLDGGSMFGNAPRAVWERWIACDEMGRIPLACRAMFVEIGSKKILCETGIGAFFEPKLAERFGVQDFEHHRLLENLTSLGVHAEDIDYVVLSHLHFDHAGGLLPTFKQIQSGDHGLVFPKAQFIVGEEAFERALHPHFRDKASFIPHLTDKLKDTGRLIIVSRGQSSLSELPQIDFFRSEGHTPGQLHTMVHGNNFNVVFAGDLIPGTPWVHLPITMGYDRYPEKLIDEKRELYDKIAQRNWYVFFTHDNKIACSKIAKNEKGKYIPIEMLEHPKHFEI